MPTVKPSSTPISRVSAMAARMIIISHRLTSLVDADAILVLERGNVHDIGRHQELLARCDIYSDLWHQQTRSVLATVNVAKAAIEESRPCLVSQSRARRRPAVPVRDRRHP